MRKRGARKGWRWRAWALPVAVLAAVFAVPPMRTQSLAQPPLSACSREAVRIQPDFAAARTNLAQVRGGGGEAGRTKDATETDAAPIEELVARAESAEQENDLAEAARLYERILEQRPDWAAVKLNLGLVYYSQQRYPEAVRILSQVVEQEPELRSAMLFLGASYYNLDRYAEAVPLLEQYLALEPASEEARPFLAASYYALNEYEASALQYLLQISLTPDNAALYFHLGEAYSAMAAALARRLEDQSSDAPAASSGNSGYHWLLTTVQQSLDEKNFALAESRLGEALALDPENNEGRLANGYYRLANGDLAAAKADFETILGNDPRHCRALQGLVDASMGLEDQAGLAEAIRRLLAIWPACLTYTVKDSDQELQTDFSGADAARAKCRQAVAKRSFRAEAAGRVERTLVMASCLEIQGAVARGHLDSAVDASRKTQKPIFEFPDPATPRAESLRTIGPAGAKLSAAGRAPRPGIRTARQPGKRRRSVSECDSRSGFRPPDACSLRSIQGADRQIRRSGAASRASSAGVSPSPACQRDAG